MGAEQSTLNNALETITRTITGTNKIDSTSSDDLMKKNTDYENIIQILDSIFTDMAFSTYIPSHVKDVTLDIENEGCKQLHGKLKTLFMNIPDDVVERIGETRLNTEKDNTKTTDEKEYTCDKLADFYVTTYLTIQDILRALSPHYIYKEEKRDTMFKSFPVYEEKNKSFADNLLKEDKSIKIADMNPCKKRMLMFHYNSNSDGNTFEFGIRNPFDKTLDVDHLNYGIDALRDLYKDEYNPVTKRFESSSNEIKNMMYLQMKDIDESNIRLGKLISIDMNQDDNNKTDNTILSIREKYNQYVKAVYDIRTHYDSSITSLNKFIMNLIQTINISTPTNPDQMLPESNKKTIRKTMTYEDILTYRKEVIKIIRNLYEKCDELCKKAMNAYDTLYNEIETKTSEYKLNNLNKQIESFMGSTSKLNTYINSKVDKSGDMIRIPSPTNDSNSTTT